MSRAIVLAALLASACSSGVLQLGPDRYRVTQEGQFLISTETSAVREATEHCAKQGKQVEVEHMISEPATVFQYANASVNFRCLPRP